MRFASIALTLGRFRSILSLARVYRDAQAKGDVPGSGNPDMNILITGNMGYVGATLVRFLRRHCPDAVLTGFDSGFFAHCLTDAGNLPETMLDRQLFGDIRDFPAGMLEGVDAVISLAAISNDPMGKRFEAVTGNINQAATIRLAALSRDAGVKNFVFASSCSVYGAAEGPARRETDATSPQTAYARSKIGSEEALRRMDLGDLTVTSLRFATACGMSDRLRLDLVLNDFVAGAVTSREITVLSDGTPWRPLIDVEDMARAIAWGVNRPSAEGGRFLIVNAGRNEANYQVTDLAEAVARAVPGTTVSINKEAPPDRRSYRVDFSLFAALAPRHIPQVTLDESIARLHRGIGSIRLDGDFRNSAYIRLKMLESHIAARRLDAELRWQAQG